MPVIPHRNAVNGPRRPISPKVAGYPPPKGKKTPLGAEKRGSPAAFTPAVDPVAALTEVLWRHANLPDMPRYPDRAGILRRAGLTEADLRPGILHAATEAARRRLHEGFSAANADPDQPLKVVVPGHEALDPEHNADHPVHGRAWHERRLAAVEEEKKVIRLQELKERRAEAANQPLPPVTIKPSPRPQPSSTKGTACKPKRSALSGASSKPKPAAPTAPTTKAATPLPPVAWRSISRKR